MKLLLFLLITSSTQLFSQELTTITTTYLSSKKKIKETYTVLKSNPTIKHGDYKSFYANGQPKMKGKYNQNKKNNEWILYRENGSIKEIQHYNNDHPTGKWEKHNLQEKYINVHDYDTDKDHVTYNTIEVFVQYPKAALEANTQGVVKLELNVDDQCNLQIKVIQPLENGCTEATIDAFKESFKFFKENAPKSCTKEIDTIEVKFQLE